MSRQTQHMVEVKYVTTKKYIFVTKDEKKGKMNVPTQRSMSRLNEEMKVEISIMTIIKQWK